MFNVIIPLLVVEMEISTGGSIHVRLKVLSHLGRYDVKGLLYLTRHFRLHLHNMDTLKLDLIVSKDWPIVLDSIDSRFNPPLVHCHIELISAHCLDKNIGPP